MDSCASADVRVENHFRETTKMVSIGSGVKRATDDWFLSRYACYHSEASRKQLGSRLGRLCRGRSSESASPSRVPVRNRVTQSLEPTCPCPRHAPTAGASVAAPGAAGRPAAVR
jgi:hypothetical protein